VKRTEPPTPEEFARMLDWLNPDPDRAAEKFLEIRSKVIKILVRRQCYEAEDLWDETSNRVSHLAQSVADTYVGDPAIYFYGVAKLVHLEWLKDEKRKKGKPDDGPSPPSRTSDDKELIHACLDKCLKELDDDDRELILKYYEKDKSEKIEQRKELARSRGITLNTLIMRVHRINGELRKCIEACLDESG
jgi:DNA-directed RNA polymerase specialized sigma24 family protein